MTSTEQQLCAIWQEVLNVAGVTTESDFFGLGGDSVATMVMLMRVEEDLSVFLDPGVIYEASTVALLAQAIDTELDTRATEAASPGPETTTTASSGTPSKPGSTTSSFQRSLNDRV